MKKLIFLLASLLSFSAIYAQDSTKVDIRHLFEHLDTSYLTTDRLGDYILPLSGLQFFTGLYDTVNLSNFVLRAIL